MAPRFKDTSEMPLEVLRELWAELMHRDKRAHLDDIRREIERREMEQGR